MGANHSVSLSTDRSSYRAGDAVSGTVTIQLTEVSRLKEIYIKVKGRESVSWKEIRDSGDRTQSSPATPATGGAVVRTQVVSQSIHEHHGSSNVYSSRTPVYRFSSEALQPGTYSFPFTLQLPLNIGCSGGGRLTDGRSATAYQSATWAVTFSLKAVLVGGSKSRFTTELFLRDRLPSNVEPTRVVQEALKRYGVCCGVESAVRAQLAADRNAFSAGELIHATAVTEDPDRRVALLRYVTLKARDNSIITERQILSSADLVPVPKRIDMDLSMIGSITGASASVSSAHVETESEGEDKEYDENVEPVLDTVLASPIHPTPLATETPLNASVLNTTTVLNTSIMENNCPADADSKYATVAPVNTLKDIKELTSSKTIHALEQPMAVPSQVVESYAKLRVPESAIPSHKGSIVTVEYFLELSGRTGADLPCVLPIKVFNVRADSRPDTPSHRGRSSSF